MLEEKPYTSPSAKASNEMLLGGMALERNPVMPSFFIMAVPSLALFLVVLSTQPPTVVCKMEGSVGICTHAHTFFARLAPIYTCSVGAY